MELHRVVAEAASHHPARVHDHHLAGTQRLATPDFPEPDLPLLHDRHYEVRSYREGPTRMRLRGAVRDQKPPGMYVEGDPEPLTMHHMVVDLVVEFPSMLITHAEVVMETHPHEECRRVEPHYGNLVGLSIARGFTHRVRELFGGPRGCSHTTALLQAMAPVAIQSVWSMRVNEDGSQMVSVPLPANPTREQMLERFAFNINTCHVWAEDSDVLERMLDGEVTPPRSITDRLTKLGIDPATWAERMRG
jgi:hypothetical protein